MAAWYGSEYKFNHNNGINAKKYPTLAKYASKIFKPKRKTLGRAKTILHIECFLDRPEYSNVILLGDPGCGKTSVVEELAREDKQHSYYSINLDAMSSSIGPHGNTVNGPVEMATRMINLKNDVIAYQQDATRERKREIAKGQLSSNAQDKEIVLFMDEFHKVEQESGAAAQALKPMLARSGQLHIRIIAADTFKEFYDNIQPDQALAERLQRITLNPPNDKTVLKILEGMMKRDSPGTHTSPGLLHHIIKITNKYMLSQSQPRKSIRVLDTMIGAHRRTKRPMDESLLADTMMISYGVRIDWNVDVNHIEQFLDSHVIDQHQASYLLAQQLYISVAGLSSPTKPQGTFLFTGTTGVGKTEMAKQLTKVLLGNENDMIRFDMANFARMNSLDTFRDELTERVADHSNWVILFDEVEKANPAVTKMLLPVLDDGELADRYGRTVSFRNAYIIMTTNAASSVYSAINDLTDTTQKVNSGHWADKFYRLIKRALMNDRDFPTEFLNRLTAFIPFKPLNNHSKRIIAFMYLQKIYRTVYNMYHIKLHIQGDDSSRFLDVHTGKVRRFLGPGKNKHPYRDGVLSYLVDDQRDTSTDSGGARGVKTTIDRSIKAKVAQFICEHRSVKDIAIRVRGPMAINEIHHRVDHAYIEVSRWKPNHQVNSRVKRNEMIKKRRQAELKNRRVV